jgi:hypothetical protein
MVISSLGISFSNSISLSLAITISMMTITTIAMSVAMGVSWLSNSCAKEGERDSNLKC